MTREHDLVSYHAVARYCERILGIALTEPANSTRGCAEAYASAAGLTIDDVRRLIWTPGIRFASRFGVCTASNGTFTVAISQPAGVITTVLSDRIRDDQRMRVMTNTELRRKAKRTVRRLKRRPSATDAMVRGAATEEE